MKTQVKVIETIEKILFQPELSSIALSKIKKEISKDFKGTVTLYDVEISRSYNFYFFRTRVNNIKGSEKDLFFMVEITRDELLYYIFQDIKSGIISASSSYWMDL